MICMHTASAAPVRCPVQLHDAVVAAARCVVQAVHVLGDDGANPAAGLRERNSIGIYGHVTLRSEQVTTIAVKYRLECSYHCSEVTACVTPYHDSQYQSIASHTIRRCSISSFNGSFTSNAARLQSCQGLVPRIGPHSRELVPPSEAARKVPRAVFRRSHELRFKARCMVFWDGPRRWRHDAAVSKRGWNTITCTSHSYAAKKGWISTESSVFT